MFIVFVFTLLVAIFGSMVTLQMTSSPALPSSQGTPATLADNFLIYNAAVTRFVATQPASYSGPGPGNAVPDTSLSFPPWYVRDARWTNTVIAGMVTTYSTAALGPLDFSSILYQRTEGGYSVGVANAAGQIVSPQYGNTSIALPAGVPAGATVVQAQVGMP